MRNVSQSRQLVRGNIFRSRGKNTPRRRDRVDRAVGRNVGVGVEER